MLLGGSINAFAYTDDGEIHNVEGSSASTADPVRNYMLVRFGEQGVNTAGLTQGDVVVWDIASDDGVSVNVVDVGGQPSVSNDAVAGVVISPTIPTQDGAGNTAAQDIGRRNWGYIQTYGLNNDANVSVGTADPSCTAGDGLRASGTAKNASCIPTSTIPASGGGATLGFIYDTVTSTQADTEIFIRTR